MRNPRWLAVLLLIPSLSRAEDAGVAKRPELQLALKGERMQVGWALDEGFAFESSLGKHAVKWSLVARMAIDADGKATLTMADNTTVTGKVLDEKVKIRKEGGTEMSFPWSKLTGLTVRMVTEPSGNDPAPELARFAETFGCAGIVSCPGGILAAADRTTPRVVFVDAATMKQRAVLKLDLEPRALALTPAGKLVISANNAVIWADAVSGSVVKSVPAGFSGRWLVAPTEEEAIVSDGNQTAVVSARRERIIFQESSGRKVSLAPSVECVLTNGSWLHFDPGADGVRRPVLCPPPADASEVENPFAGTSGFLLDNKRVVLESGHVCRLGVGAGPPLVKVAQVALHRCGTAIRGGKAMVLFDTNRKLFIVEAETWKYLRHASVEMDVFAAAAVDDKSVCVLIVPIPEAKPFGAEEYFSMSGPPPASLVKVSLEE